MYKLFLFSFLYAHIIVHVWTTSCQGRLLRCLLMLVYSFVHSGDKESESHTCMITEYAIFLGVFCVFDIEIVYVSFCLFFLEQDKKDAEKYLEERMVSQCLFSVCIFCNKKGIKFI